MREVDVAIVGGGLAGSTAAAMLGRAGISAVLIDPHKVYPPELRCEKLDGLQTRVLRKTGLADAVLRAATFDGSAWVARRGRLIDRRPSDQHGIMYDALVNTMRAQIPPQTEFLNAKAARLATSTDRQLVTLSTGEEISARLIVLANGLNIALRHSLGLEREVFSQCHSITLGFDIAPRGRFSFDFRALSYYPESPVHREAYISLFPIGGTMRANYMVYRDMNDPWLRRMRQAPFATMLETMPRLTSLTGDFEVTGEVKIRPADLYRTMGHIQPGVVLVGDAFATSCPAAGTGTGKVFTDVERLCNEYVPRWLASPGMGPDKIAAFYDDPVKRASDAASLAKAYYLRSLSMDTSLHWQTRRRVHYFSRLVRGLLRQAYARLNDRAEPSSGQASGAAASVEKG